MFINFVKQQIEIVEEECHPTSTINVPRTRSRSNPSAASGVVDDDAMLNDVLQQELPLDEDEPLLSFDGPGV